MANDPQIRYANLDDLQQITDIYNHYVENSATTFDTKPWTKIARIPWFEQFSHGTPHQCWVLVEEDKILGYASSTQFRPKPAYNTSVESTIYLHPSALGNGYGQDLYKHLFGELNKLALNRCYGIITLPNTASVKLHEALGFKAIGVLTEVGYKFDQYWDTIWLEKKLGAQMNGEEAP
ncbi:MAG: phosphinothricin acetyltransferase [Candidatus Azotimanducaceae bacterium]|jgi:phosphinothricin acetyltransferase